MLSNRLEELSQRIPDEGSSRHSDVDLANLAQKQERQSGELRILKEQFQRCDMCDIYREVQDTINEYFQHYGNPVMMLGEQIKELI